MNTEVTLSIETQNVTIVLKLSGDIAQLFPSPRLPTIKIVIDRISRAITISGA